jgi:periplasmic protein TonB
MFEALPASFTVAPPRARAITSALVLHAVLIGLAVSSTASSGVTAPRIARDTIRVDLAVIEQRQDNAPPPTPASPSMPSAPSVPNSPTKLPEFELPQLSFTGPVSASVSGAAPALSGLTSTAILDSSPSLYRSTEVDELPQLLTDLRPEYPDVLRHAGISGAVEVEYVVGKDGRIEPHSLRVLTTDHEQFTRSVVYALRPARFKAARRAGQPVAVLVRQAIRFRSETP